MKQGYINHNFYDFIILALDALKVDRIKKLNYNYIKVPSTVDICEMKEGKMFCDENKPYSERKKKIKEYLDEKIVKIF